MVAPSGSTITLANAGHLNQYFNGSEVPAETNLPLGLAACIRYSKIQPEPATKGDIVCSAPR
jgi:hypothetical protein